MNNSHNTHRVIDMTQSGTSNNRTDTRIAVDGVRDIIKSTRSRQPLAKT